MSKNIDIALLRNHQHLVMEGARTRHSHALGYAGQATFGIKENLVSGTKHHIVFVQTVYQGYSGRTYFRLGKPTYQERTTAIVYQHGSIFGSPKPEHSIANQLPLSEMKLLYFLTILLHLAVHHVQASESLRRRIHPQLLIGNILQSLLCATDKSRRTSTVFVQIGCYHVTVVAGESIVRGKPQKALLVLLHIGDDIRGQSILNGYPLRLHLYGKGKNLGMLLHRYLCHRLRANATLSAIMAGTGEQGKSRRHKEINVSHYSD